MSGASIIIWILDVREWNPTRDAWEACLRSIIDPKYRDRVLRYSKGPRNLFEGRTHEDTKCFVAGRLQLQRLCAAKVGHGKHPLIEEAENGKPFVSNLSDGVSWNFNISHDGYCVAVGESSVPLGIDVMVVRLPSGIDDGRTPSMDDVSTFMQDFVCYFSKEEWGWCLEGSSGEDRLKRFFIIWTLTESFIKATGDGLSFDVSRISFSMCGETKNAVVECLTIDGVVQCEEFSFQTFWILDNVVGSVATGRCGDVSLHVDSMDTTFLGCDKSALN